MENYEAQKGAPFLKIPLVMFDNEYFMNWMGTAESRIWHKMFRHCVRAPMITKLNKKIHKEYYKNGIVAMYKSQEYMAEFLGQKSTSRISKIIKSMVEKGIIIPHNDKWNNRRIVIYELATHDKTVNKHETIHLFDYFCELKKNSENGAHLPKSEMAT
jgi:hypothetical protein